jgi:thiamine biosynthesis lipoprotein
MNAPPGKSGWTVRVPQPGDRSKTVAIVTLRNESLSTSGNYENFFQLEGRRYCHVIDPRQGMPVQGVLQTTLITSDNTASDALSNAMFVLGFEAGRNVLATLPDARGLWILGEPESQRVAHWRWHEHPQCENRQGLRAGDYNAKEQRAR